MDAEELEKLRQSYKEGLKEHEYFHLLIQKTSSITDEYIIIELYNIVKRKIEQSFCEWQRKDLSISSYDFALKNVKKIILSNIENPDFKDFGILLSFDASTILKDYQDIDFNQYPELQEANKSMTAKDDSYSFNNYIPFFKFINKLTKSGKSILSLYILNLYGGFNNQGTAKLLVECYINIFVSLDRYDLLVEYYEELEIIKQDLEFLVNISKYFIDNKMLKEAQSSLKQIEYLEPSIPYLKKAKAEIENISLIEKVLSKNINIETINILSGKEFEDLLIEQFKKLGYKTFNTPVTGDYGADIILETESKTRFIIQCKRFKSKVNLKAVQEVVGALAHFNGDIGIVITNNTFLNSAIKLADSNDVELWDNNKLMKFLTDDISFSQISIS